MMSLGYANQATLHALKAEREIADLQRQIDELRAELAAKTGRGGSEDEDRSVVRTRR
jgi:hypothetical protein